MTTRDEPKVYYGNQIELGASPSFGDVGHDYARGTQTTATLTLTTLGDNAGRQSAKIDLGAAWAGEHHVDAAFDLTGETVDATGYVAVYWAPSASTTQGTANVGGNSGADGAAGAGCPDTGVTIDEFLEQGCELIGVLNVNTYAGVYAGAIASGRNVWRPSSRFGQVIVVNRAGAPFEASNSNMAVWLNGIVPQGQTEA